MTLEVASKLSSPKYFTSLQMAQISKSWAERNPPIGTPLSPCFRIMGPTWKRLLDFVSKVTYGLISFSLTERKVEDAPVPFLSSS